MKLPSKCLLAVLTLLPLFSLAGKSAGESPFYMVRDGKACGIIVWRSGNNYAAEAAKELQYAFKKISGATVPLLPAVPAGHTGNVIHVGYPQKAPAGLKSPSYLPPEGYLLKTIGKTLYLFGDDKLLSKKWNIHRDGTFAAVQYLLDEYFGCRFFMAGKAGEYYPPNKNIVIPQLSVQKSPGMPNRVLRCYRKDEEGRLFTRRHRLGRAFVYEGSHAFEHWYKRYGKTHPDLFALQLDGTRIPPYAHRSQQCITHPAFLDLWFDQVVSQMNNRPEIIAVSFTYNDAGSHFFCRCANCRALDPANVPNYRYYYGVNHKDKGYMPAITDRYISVLNKAARRLAREWPGKFILYTAYRNGSSAPVREKIEPNVVIFYAGFNYVSDKGRKLGRENFAKWRKLTPNIVVRPNYLHHGACMPLFYGRKMYEDFQFCTKAGVLGWDFDAMSGHWGATGFHYYLAARLQTRPELSYEKIFDEYCKGLYGPAEKAMKHYFSELEKFTDKIAASGNNNGIQGGWGVHAPTYYTEKEIKRFEGLLDAALAAAGKNTAVRENIILCRLPWEYTRLLCAGLRKVRQAGNSRAGAAEFAALDRWRAKHSQSKAINVRNDLWRMSCRRTAAKSAAEWQQEENEFVMPLEY